MQHLDVVDDGDEPGKIGAWRTVNEPVEKLGESAEDGVEAWEV